MIKARDRTFLISILLVALFLSCSRAPILIGFVSPESGTTNDLGIEATKGLTLALAEANAAGGIKGRRLDVIREDDGADPAACLAAVQRLEAQKVRFIILHTTSAAAAKAIEWASTKDILVLTHTVSDPRWVGGDDNLIRFVSTIDGFGEALRRYAEKLGVKTAYAAIDNRNLAYGEAIVDGFDRGEEAKAVVERVVLSGPPDPAAIAAAAIADKVGAVILVVPGMDAAKVAQALHKAHFGGYLLLSPWSLDNNLLTYAGAFAPRILLPSTLNFSDQDPSYLAFKDRFKRLYSTDPATSAIYAYEVTEFLAQGLSRAGSIDPMAVKRSMLANPVYKGVQFDYTLDANGDSTSPLFIVGIDPKTGRLASVATVSAERNK